ATRHVDDHQDERAEDGGSPKHTLQRRLRNFPAAPVSRSARASSLAVLFRLGRMPLDDDLLALFVLGHVLVLRALQLLAPTASLAARHEPIMPPAPRPARPR